MDIPFQTEAQRHVYGKVSTHLHAMFADSVQANADRPLFYLSKGSAIAQVSVMPWSEDDAIVNVRAYVVFGASVERELLHFLLRCNDRVRFGAFGLDEDDDIFFEHRLVGSCCDQAEIAASVLAVLQTADEYDDVIQARWGGERAVDEFK